MQSRVKDQPDGRAYDLDGGALARDMQTMSLSYDERAMSATCVFSTGALDRQGDIVEVSGIRTENHRRNPVVMWGHGKCGLSFPIGKTYDRAGNYTVRIDGETARQTTYFSQTLPEAEKIFKLICEGIICANSIGFENKVVRPIYNGGKKGLHVLECDLLEISWTHVPVNFEAVTKQLLQTSAWSQGVTLKSYARRAAILKSAEFDESKHPRANDGRFGTKPGEHGGGEAPDDGIDSDDTIDGGGVEDYDATQSRHAKEYNALTSRQDREVEKLSAKHEKTMQKLVGQHEREDSKVAADREREDDRIQAKRDKEDEKISARREKEDSKIEAVREKEDADLEVRRDRHQENVDAIEAQREQEDSELEDSRSNEDEEITKRQEQELEPWIGRETEDGFKELSDRLLREDQELAAKREKEDAEIAAARKAEDDEFGQISDALDAVQEALEAKRDAEDDELQAARDDEDERLSNDRQAEDDELQAARDDEDAEREQRQSGEIDDLEQQHDAEFSDLEDRHETERETLSARHDDELEEVEADDDGEPQIEIVDEDDENPRKGLRFWSTKSTSTKSSGGGRWITIGGKRGKDGERAGGSPVYIENGRITRGAPSLTGRKIDALKEGAEGFGVRQANKIEGEYSRAKWGKQARSEGIEPKHLHQLAAEIVEHDKESSASLRQMLSQVKKNNPWLAGVVLNSRHGIDQHSIKPPPGEMGLDQIAQEIAESREFGHLFGRNEDDDGVRGDHSERLFDYLINGAPEAMDENDAYEQAMEILREHQASADMVPAFDPDDEWR